MGRLHVLGDEAGDLVFKEPGNGVSRYFMIGTVTLADRSVGEKFLALRRELAWEGILLDQLHATSDRQHVRDRAFDLIAQTNLRYDATILDKRKAKDELRADTTKAAVHEAVAEVVNQVSPTVTCHCAFSPAATDPAFRSRIT